MCETNEIEYIDLYNLEGMRLSDDTFETCFADGLHPNDEGQAVLADAIWEKMDGLLN